MKAWEMFTKNVQKTHGDEVERSKELEADLERVRTEMGDFSKNGNNIQEEHKS